MARFDKLQKKCQMSPAIQGRAICVMIENNDKNTKNSFYNFILNTGKGVTMVTSSSDVPSADLHLKYFG